MLGRGERAGVAVTPAHGRRPFPQSAGDVGRDFLELLGDDGDLEPGFAKGHRRRDAADAAADGRGYGGVEVGVFVVIAVSSLKLVKR